MPSGDGILCSTAHVARLVGVSVRTLTGSSPHSERRIWRRDGPHEQRPYADPPRMPLYGQALVGPVSPQRQPVLAARWVKHSVRLGVPRVTRFVDNNAEVAIGAIKHRLTSVRRRSNAAFEAGYESCAASFISRWCR